MSREPPAPHETLFAELMERLEEGASPDVAALAARHRLTTQEVDAALHACRGLRALRTGLRSAEGGPGERLGAGTVLGGFEVVDELARGGMGIVYRARQLALAGRAVALKVGSRSATSPTARARFEREARILAELHHPHLAEVYGFGEEGGRAFLAMQLVEGSTLAALLGRDAGCAAGQAETRLRRTVELVLQVARALSELHGRGLIHRDVKPANVILEGSSGEDPLRTAARAVLVDFGLARPILGATATRTRYSPATFEYASPEQMLGEALDARTDVFSLGVVLHDLLTGRSPSERLRASAGLEALEAWDPAIDADLAAVVAKACDPDRRWRYRSAVELAGDLEAWLAGRAVSARRARIAQRARRWLVRHPMLVLRGVALSALALGALWVGSALGGVWSAGLRLRTAWREGDLLAAQEAASLMRPSSTALAALLWPEVAEARASFARAGATEGTRGIARDLARGDESAAYLAAVAELALAGECADPLLERFLQRGLRALPSAEVHPWPIAALARYYYENPIGSAAGLSRAEGLRAEVRRLSQLDDRHELDALLALTALGGCGTAQDLTALARIAEPESRDRERLRLALVSAATLIGRAPACGMLDALPLEQIEAVLAPLARRRFAAGGLERIGLAYELERAVDLLVLSVALARRQRGEPVPVAAWIPSPVPFECEGQQAWLAERRFPLACVLAVAADPRVAGWWRADRPLTDPGQPSFEQCGLLCGYLADEETTARLLAQQLCYGPGPLTLFEKGWAHATRRRLGGLPVVDADRETRLEFQHGPPSASADPPDPWLEWQPQPARASGRTGVLLVNDEQPLQGSLTRLEARQVGLDRRFADAHARFYAAGESEAVLHFALPPDGLGRDYVLELLHQSANRDALPWLGDVVLEISFNGIPIHGGLRVSSGGRRSDTVQLSAKWLRAAPAGQPAEQTLSMRLLPASTTTYWLHRVVLSAAEP